ncbi:hypothetical protein VB796_01055 [Arcicella sp. LKC2W]|uniref:hypothetical protein n=1 Tax=Arcicella sp. LKC2W TaxID=2984198 RepID=UPI002B21B09F|nr:hypothetical protein [Arcicella sp. LKC2W]MEA5457603.1 hypothetical protein [Arcicella sp. LKC2W]
MTDYELYEVVYNKAYISATLCLLALIAFRFRNEIESFFARFGKGKSFFLIAFFLRILPFLVVYVYYGYDAQSDVQIFWKSAQEAAKLKLVYRDFESLYSPFFAYITALPLVFWDTARAVTLLMILIEMAVLWLTMKTYPDRSSASTLFKGLIYLLLPAPYIFCVLGGQEDIWMWGFACLVVYAWQKKKSDLVLGMITGLGLLATKAFFVLLLPLLFLKLKNKGQFVLGNAIVGLPVLLILYISSGTSFLMPIRLAQEPMAVNMWSVINPLIWDYGITADIKLLNWIGLFVILTIAIWQTLKDKTLDIQQFMPKIWMLIFGVMMVVQIGAYANYIFIFAMPLIFGFNFFKNKTFLIITFLVQSFATVQPSFWFRIGKPFLRFDNLLGAKFAVEYTLEMVVFVGVIYWLTKVLKSETK